MRSARRRCWLLAMTAWVALVVGAGSAGSAPPPVSRQPASANASPSGVTAAQARKWERHALTHRGDPVRGRALFRDERLTKCSICHKVNGDGGEAGPDLTHIGGKFDRPHLIESLLDPSAQIVEGFRSRVIVTSDGRLHTGIVKSRSREHVELVDVEARTRTIPVEEIAEQRDSAVSLMPENLLEALTPEQFVDLVAYLESLRAAGKPTPGADTHGPITVAAGFTVRTLATGISAGTALETTADGRVFVCEQRGALRVVRDGRLLDEPFVTLPVDDFWERGLIGVTVHPGFPAEPYVYVCYVAKEPYTHHRVSRFTAAGDRAVPGSERILLAGDDQRTLGGHVPAGHQGGALHFGTDGTLYVAIGEQTAETPAQSLSSFQGKILRINPDGTIPDDNPLLDQTSGKYRAIWALGLRNPFTFAVREPGGELFINDVGGRYEEINRGVAGGNYGWPAVEHGRTGDSRFISPIHTYPQASISGGDFAPGELDWSEPWRGRYFFADFVHGWIHALDPDRPAQVEAFVTGLRRPVDLRFGPDGSLYVLLRNAWVIDGKFEPNTGSLLQFRSGASE